MPYKGENSGSIKAVKLRTVVGSVFKIFLPNLPNLPKLTKRSVLSSINKFKS